MRDRYEAVVFRNRRGHQLFGVLHHPEHSRKDVAVLMPAPGIKMRVGPHRLYLGLANTFVAKGLYVLRFDPHGLGDSEADLPETQTPHVYNAIQDGCCVEDTLDAMDWMTQQYGVHRFIAAGLCGAAVTSLLAAEQDRRIEGLIGLGIPVSFEGGKADYGKFVTEGELTILGHDYLHKLKEPRCWARLLTFKSNFRVIAKVLRRLLWRIPLGKGTPKPARSTRRTALLANMNPKFAPAFFNMLQRRRPMLILFGETDRWNHEFSEKFEAVHRTKLGRLPKSYDKIIVPDANHIFSRRCWRTAVEGHISVWLDLHVPRPGGRRGGGLGTVA